MQFLIIIPLWHKSTYKLILYTSQLCNTTKNSLLQKIYEVQLYIRCEVCTSKRALCCSYQ